MHDDLCERGPAGLVCLCATRAWQRDPLPDDLTPIWDAPKPKLEGTP